MYYSPSQQPPQLFDPPAPANKTHLTSTQQSWKVGAIVASLALLIGLGVAATIQSKTMSKAAQPANNVAATAVPTPQVAGVSFGDILKKKLSFQGWVAGTQAGNVVLMQPDSGSLMTVQTAKNTWYGPISDLVWSPDRSKLAYIVIPESVVGAVAKNPSVYGQQNNLGDLPTPSAFPFGRLVVVDLATKQLTNTSVEVRNTKRSFVWLDDQHLASVAQSLSVYNLSDGTTTALSSAGSTNPDELLQSPLVWQASSQTLYYTKVRRGPEQSVKLLMSLRRDTNQVTEVTPLKTGAFEDVTNMTSADMTLSDDGTRLAVVSQDGLSYRTIEDGGMHPLPYKDEWVWLRESSMSDLLWLSPSKLAFTSLTIDGVKVWGVWDIPSAKLYTFGQDSRGGSWDKASSRLVLIQPDGQHLGFLTPDWNDQTASVLKTVQASWDTVSW